VYFNCFSVVGQYVHGLVFRTFSSVIILKHIFHVTSLCDCKELNLCVHFNSCTCTEYVECGVVFIMTGG